MKNRPTLSIAPYYGGKGRMAHFIADRLNYDDSDVFLTPFGGMCRVLLNKPRHRVECYNDFSSGLCALMTVLSDPKKADELIHRLYNETVHSQEEFDKQKVIFDNAEMDLEQQEREKLRRLVIDNNIVSAAYAKDFLDVFMSQAVPHDTKGKENSEAIQAAFVKLNNKFKKNSDFKNKFQSIFDNWVQLYQLKEEQGYIERSADMGEYVSEMDLAIATYVVFQQSRDGMGQTWSKEKFKTTDQYLKQVLKLYECAERLEGVEVFQIDAVEFFRSFHFIDVNLPDEEIDPGFLMLNEWINNPRVMMYCDPSYISVESERELLEGIDIYNVDSLSDAIKEKYGDKMPKNLGKVYAKSFGYDDQEKFLRCIQNAKCRILVSNYDLELYNKYLNESTGWRREEFITTTSVGSKLDNTRIEVIWYNY